MCQLGYRNNIKLNLTNKKKMHFSVRLNKLYRVKTKNDATLNQTINVKCFNLPIEHYLHLGLYNEPLEHLNELINIY